MRLERYGRPVETIFDLLGRQEDDMTYALGYVASRSDSFARAFLREVCAERELHLDDAVVRLQSIGRDGEGRTDVEFDARPNFAVIVEAKRGAEFPSVVQLRRYASRLRTGSPSGARLVTVTNASESHARFAIGSVDGVPVKHVSWRRVYELTKQARRDDRSNRSNVLLDEFSRYLREILGMESARSNMVLVVSLSAGGAWGLGFKEVTDQRMYFDPVKRHRQRMPNYLAFRFAGRLQSIHHVEGVSTFTRPRTVFPEAADVEVEPHFVFNLGPPIVPQREVRNGPRIHRSMRVWCMIDTLLTCATISDALTETHRRLRGSGGPTDVHGSDGE